MSTSPFIRPDILHVEEACVRPYGAHNNRYSSPIKSKTHRRLKDQDALCPHALLRYLLTGLALLFCMPILANSTIVVTGVEDDLKTNVELIAGKPPEDKDSRKYKRYIAELPDLASEALSALGYYGATTNIYESTVEEESKITIAVTPNDPVLVEDLAVSIAGDGFKDPAYMSILSELPIVKGRVFISAEYEATKAVLLDRAQDLGYFDFTFTKSEVRVSRKQLSANILLQAVQALRG